ncbi:response regulator [Brevundimonas variabilis]|uniref:CheY-like chemotaxis protein n=1 Tax=Brevundimonas variabilis TaxID=74312 RepID=A0A7W9CGQ0_9CAUL|nr:response regulator [Brevundimonas variabilis]MBB5745191.1 CheY-like chemotaxis protein [Brevundimonas variabilis]
MANILIADDDPVFLEIISLALMIRGHEITTAVNGVGAIELAKQGKFDLIILDIHMPEKDGLETILALKDMNCTAPIVAVSAAEASGYGNYLGAAKTFGATATIRKPVNHCKLHDIIMELTGSVTEPRATAH